MCAREVEPGVLDSVNLMCPGVEDDGVRMSRVELWGRGRLELGGIGNHNKHLLYTLAEKAYITRNLKLCMIYR